MRTVNKIIVSVGFSVFCVLFLLTLSVVPKLQNALPLLSPSSSFSELPMSSNIFIDELRKHNNELRTCKERKRCLLLIGYTQVLRSRVETLSNNTEPFGYIRKLYGDSSYAWIIENKDLIELQFDERLTRELLTRTNGKILSEDSGFTKQEVHDIYYDYINKTGFHLIYEKGMSAETPQMRALYAYQTFLLFSDVRLYQMK